MSYPLSTTLRPLTAGLLVAALSTPLWAPAAAPVRPTTTTASATSQLPPILRNTIAELQQALQLSAAQQVLFAQAVSATSQAYQQVHANHQAMLAATRATLAQERPDLNALAAQADASQLANLELRHGARAQWLQLYDSLTPEQVALCKALLLERLDRLEALRELLPSVAVF